MTVAQWYQQLITDLGDRKEAKWLIAAALQKNITLDADDVLTEEEDARLQDWATRRLSGEPLSRLTGVREFWSLPFHLNEATLDPRPETELLVESVLPYNPQRILDLGTGTGCVLISLLHERLVATGLGVDLNPAAVQMAGHNAALNGVEARATFVQGNWGEGLIESFDTIVSNPPYIAAAATLDKNVRDYDPSLALFAGDDGLEAYRLIRHDIKRLLAPGGIAALEFGQGQRQDVEALFHAVGFETQFVHKDLAGIERVVGFKHPALKEPQPLSASV